VPRVSLYEWLLFLHVLAAFSLVAGLTAYGVLVLGGDAARRALALWNVGGLGVLVLGIWLALEVDSYELWDGWIIAAFVLWLVASGAGGRLARMLREGGPDKARVQLAVMSLATLALLIDMVFKPGA
jgi:uncharacterized membrane protein